MRQTMAQLLKQDPAPDKAQNQLMWVQHMNSGGNNYNQAVCDFARGHQVVLVCPEVLGGLPTPRCPAEIVQDVVTNKEGINVDREFRAGAAKALAIAKENGVELAILQSRSPSCGVKEIYDGTFSETKIIANDLWTRSDGRRSDAFRPIGGGGVFWNARSSS